MSILNFLSTYIGDDPVQDADPITNSQPDVTNESYIGAKDGDEALASQLNTLKYKLHAVAKLVGDSLSNPVGSLCHILDRDHVNKAARFLRMWARSADPTAAASTGYVFVEVVSGKVELMYFDSAGTKTQLTSNGTINAAALGLHGPSHETGQGDEFSVAGLLGVLGTDQNADAIRETAGPTLLSVGAILDKQVLTRSGSTVAGGIKVNSAASAPGVTDDSAAGYSPGSIWVDTTGPTPYMCADASVGAAVWTNVSGGGGGGFTAYEQEFTATAGTNEFTLNATPAVNANTLSGRNILGVSVNGVRARYQATLTGSNEYNQSGGTNKINMIALNAGDIVTVVYGV